MQKKDHKQLWLGLSNGKYSTMKIVNKYDGKTFFKSDNNDCINISNNNFLKWFYQSLN